MAKVLLTGGSGLLGSHLQKYIKCSAPSHKDMDITRLSLKKRKCDLVIHCAAYTDVEEAEICWEKCLSVNYHATKRLRKLYEDTPFVYISTEYAKNHENYYGYTKWMGEEATKLYKPYLIIRTLFKPDPFPWPQAFMDQYTQGDYITIIAPLIAVAIKEWDRKESKLIYIGTGRKTMFDLAKQTRPDVKPCSIHDIEDVKIPGDYL